MAIAQDTNFAWFLSPWQADYVVREFTIPNDRVKPHQRGTRCMDCHQIIRDTEHVARLWMSPQRPQHVTFHHQKCGEAWKGAPVSTAA